MLIKHWNLEDGKTLTETISSLILNQHKIVTVVPTMYKQIGNTQVLIKSLIIYN